MMYNFRQTTRHSSDRTIIYSEINGPRKYQNVKMYNFNEEGVFFESNDELDIGAEIIIEVSNYFPGPVVPDGSDSYRAEVRWCKKIPGAESFAVGTRIIDHYFGKRH